MTETSISGSDAAGMVPVRLGFLCLGAIAAIGLYNTSSGAHATLDFKAAADDLTSTLCGSS